MGKIPMTRYGMVPSRRLLMTQTALWRLTLHRPTILDLFTLAFPVEQILRTGGVLKERFLKFRAVLTETHIKLKISGQLDICNEDCWKEIFSLLIHKMGNETSVDARQVLHLSNFFSVGTNRSAEIIDIIDFLSWEADLAMTLDDACTPTDITSLRKRS